MQPQEMIRTYHQDSYAIRSWLESYVKPHLTPDVSSYAPGRMRCWLGEEPSLTSRDTRPALPISEETYAVFSSVARFPVDYVLCTFSGAESPVGIRPHRDAGYADHVAATWNVSGTCRMKVWMDRNATESGGFLECWLTPGAVVHFPCKHLHSAEPSTYRWALHFWRAKLR